MSALLFIRGVLVFGIGVGGVMLMTPRGRRIHPSWMLSCIMGDLALLAYVVITRQPIQKVVGLSDLHTSGVGLVLHVVTAVGLLASYFMAWRLGRDASRARRQGVAVDLGNHRLMGISVLLFLLVNYFTTPGFVFDWCVP